MGQIVGTKYDRRVKLDKSQKEEIILSHERGAGVNELARTYEVSRRTIQFILRPEALERNKELREKRGGSKIYYDKDKNTEKMREHRNYKKELEESGLLE